MRKYCKFKYNRPLTRSAFQINSMAIQGIISSHVRLLRFVHVPLATGPLRESSPQEVSLGKTKGNRLCEYTSPTGGTF